MGKKQHCRHQSQERSWGRRCPGTAAAHGEDMMEQIPTLQPSCGTPCVEAGGGASKQLQPTESSCWRISEKNCSPWWASTGTDSSWRTAPDGKDPHWSREKQWEEGSSKILRTNQNSHSLSLCTAQDEEGKKSWKKEWSWACKRCVVYSFVLVSYLLLLTGNKLNYLYPIRVCFTFDSNWWVISLSLPWPISFFTLFFIPSLLGMGEQLHGHLAIRQS